MKEVTKKKRGIKNRLSEGGCTNYVVSKDNLN